ncbi:DUF2326 domain-containing protein [Lichenibacterium ramalinae]|uniref:DUF2326 domain-containing protein n=1 Tax=Lichenibacterium ramalinae TaxID=2316527 RepID=A0A4Q2R7K7_9HYPH|nr:DUF2326 domain-containing protein [Lichenibacterium ramalinae]RYB01669.1 DUF2326 domain-containing protein [Lichenibacterium ramalinae]
MLHRLSANNSSFKAFAFRNGFNIIVADRRFETEIEDKEPQRRTRNGVGKSSLIDVIHFLLGGKPEGALTSEIVSEWTYHLTLDVGDERFTVERCPAETKLLIETDIGTSSPFRSGSEIPNSAWTNFLGATWFKLSPNRPPGGASFRQLITYFTRRRRDGGYDDPIRTFRAQTNSVSEANLAVLFGIDAEIVRRFYKAKNSLKQIQVAQKALRDIDKSSPAGSRRIDLEAQLSAMMAAATLARDQLRARIDAFNVLPIFRELEQELASLNQRGRDLSDEDVLDSEALDANKNALETEGVVRGPQLEKLFTEAQLVFPAVINRRYEEVYQFHQKLIENRRTQLQNENSSILRRIQERQPQREALEIRRRQIITALKTGGPADELLRLRDELSNKEGVVRVLEARLIEARSLEQQAEDLQQEIEEAVRALRQDRRERSSIIDQASRIFSEISERLYESPGQLAISASEQGLRFLPTMPSSQSAGIMSMQIFCFDFTMAALCQSRGLGPGFLLHDSHLFEPVDGRQFARSLRLGAEYSQEIGIQYIVTLNSDELMRAELEGKDSFSEFVIKPVLSDEPDGGLFGVRFD